MAIQKTRRMAIQITADITDLKKKMDETKRMVKDQSTSLQGMAAGWKTVGSSISSAIGMFKAAFVTKVITDVAKGVFNLSKAAGEYGEQIELMAMKTGMSVKAAQEWKYIAGQLDFSYESLQTGTGKFTKTIQAGLKPTDDTAKIFKALKIEIKDIGTGALKPINELFTETLMKLSKIKDETTRDIVMSKLFGKSYQELIPIVEAGADEIAKLQARFNELKIGVSEAEIKQLAKYDKKLDELGQRFDVIGRKIGTGFIPMLEKVEPIINSWSNALKNTIEEIFTGFPTLIPGLNPALNSFFGIFGQREKSEARVAKNLQDQLNKKLSNTANWPKIVPPKIKSEAEKEADAFQKALQAWIDSLGDKNKEVKSKMNDFADSFKSAYDKIINTVSVFDRAQANPVYSMQRLINRMKGQYLQIKLFKDNLKSLEGKVSPGLYNALAAEGPAAAKQIGVLAKAKPGQLKQYEQLFGFKSGYAREAAAMQTGPAMGYTAQSAWRAGGYVININLSGMKQTDSEFEKMGEQLIKILKRKKAIK